MSAQFKIPLASLGALGVLAVNQRNDAVDAFRSREGAARRAAAVVHLAHIDRAQHIRGVALCDYVGEDADDFETLSDDERRALRATVLDRDAERSSDRQVRIGN